MVVREAIAMWEVMMVVVEVMVEVIVGMMVEVIMTLMTAVVVMGMVWCC